MSYLDRYTGAIVPDNHYPKLTVGKLKELLSKFDDNLPVVTESRNNDGHFVTDFANYWEEYPNGIQDVELHLRHVVTDYSDPSKIVPALVISILP